MKDALERVVSRRRRQRVSAPARSCWPRSRRASPHPVEAARRSWLSGRRSSPRPRFAIASPPGRAVVDRVREIVGVERAQPALFSLPGGGRLLVDRSRRHVGRRRERQEAPASRIPRRELVAVRPLPRGGARQRARSARAGRRASAGHWPAAMSSRLSGRARRRTRGSRTSIGPGFESSRATA